MFTDGIYIYELCLSLENRKNEEMIDKELKIFFLKTKLENESKNLNSDSFFELIKDRIGWKKYHEIYRECTAESLLDMQTHNKLTELGKATLLSLELEHTKENKDKEAERKKLHNESKLSEWQVKTYWWIFGFAVIGFVFGIYNFTSSLTPSKDIIRQEQSIKKMESELSKLRILILTQKKDTLLIHQNSEKGK